jgi:hypothetical protein
LSCGDEDTVSYVRFNGDDDVVTISVGVEDLLDDVTIDLHSTTGEVVIGSATVSPGGGPVGTTHDVVVVIADDYEEKVDRVSVRVDSGDRGEDEYDLERDSADEGYYKLSMVSVGDDGEVREDTFTIKVWDEDGDSDGDTAGGDTSRR